MDFKCPQFKNFKFSDDFENVSNKNYFNFFVLIFSPTFFLNFAPMKCFPQFAAALPRFARILSRHTFSSHFSLHFFGTPIPNPFCIYRVFQMCAHEIQYRFGMKKARQPIFRIRMFLVFKIRAHTFCYENQICEILAFFVRVKYVYIFTFCFIILYFPFVLLPKSKKT